MGEKKFNIPMCAALILLLLTMISIHLTSGLYARYTVTATASDSARVARFDVRSEVQPVAGEEGKFSIKVTNASEVAVSYRVDVVFAESLEEGKLSVTLDEKSGIWKAETKTLSFDTVATMAPGILTNTHVLVFEVLEWSLVTSGGSGEEITRNLAFTVNVIAEQVD